MPKYMSFFIVCLPLSIRTGKDVYEICSVLQIFLTNETKDASFRKCHVYTPGPTMLPKLLAGNSVTWRGGSVAKSCVGIVFNVRGLIFFCHFESCMMMNYEEKMVPAV